MAILSVSLSLKHLKLMLKSYMLQLSYTCSSPTHGKKFRDHAINTFVWYISSLLRQVERVDLVWDRYFAESLKNYTKEKRGVEVRRKVIGNYLLPRNWMTFLRCSENKAELFPYLLNLAFKGIQDRVTVSTVNENVVTNRDFSMQYGGSWWKDLCSCETCFKRTRLNNDQGSWQRRSRNNYC